MLVTMKCPSCAADLQIDDAREFMFCQYCGTKIANIAEKVEISGSVTIDNSATIKNLLHRGYEFENANKFNEAIGYYNRILDIQYDNNDARQSIARCNKKICDSFIHKGLLFEKDMKIDEAIACYKKALEVLPSNEQAKINIARCVQIVTDSNVFISFVAKDRAMVLQTSINNGLIAKYNSGTTKAFVLPVGKYIVKFRVGAHRFSREIVINDRYTRVNINYKQDGRNHIEITY